MANLEKYYDARAVNLGEQEFLKQVGHTEGGQPITQVQFDRMVLQLHELLDLCSGDRLLDLCCGNGVITRQLAGTVQDAVGIELSQQLVGIATKYHSAPHIRFIKHDVMRLDQIACVADQAFSKVVMQGALQHFRAAALETLLEKILTVTTDNPVIVFGFVPEHGKQRHFYNTPRRKIEAVVRRAVGRDVFGSWWDKNHVTNVCRKLGLACSFHDVDTSLKASKYRCNIKITRPDHDLDSR